MMPRAGRRLGLVAALVLAGSCRDYGIFTADMSAVPGDMGDLSVAALDLATDGAAPPVDLSSSCPPLVGVFAPIATETASNTSGSVNPSRVYAGYFDSTAALEVVAVKPGPDSTPGSLSLWHRTSAANFVRDGAFYNDCVGAVAVGNVAGGPDQVFAACDCESFTGTCAVRRFAWDGFALSAAQIVQTDPGRPVSIAFGLVDADPYGDLVVGINNYRAAVVDASTGYPPAELRIFRGKSDGSLDTNPIVVPLLMQANPGFLAIADFNGDGRRDIAVYGVNLAGSAQLLTLATQDVGGNFSPYQDATLVTTGKETSMIAGDVTGDGLADLVFSNTDSAKGIVILDQLPASSGSRFGNTPVDVSGFGFGPAIVDWDRDGKNDLFFWRQPNAMLTRVEPFLLQNLTPSPFTQVPSAATIARTSAVVPAIGGPAIADLDGDCAPELIFADVSTPTLYVLSR